MRGIRFVPFHNWERAARAQLRFIPAAPRRGMLVFLIIAFLLVLTRSCQFTLDLPNRSLVISGLFGVYLLFLIGAALWAVSIWYREGPSHRGYHWTLPVDRRLHDVLRVFSGAAWLLGFLAVPVLAGMAVYHFTGAPEAGLPLPGWIWLTHLTGPLTLYLLCSTASLRSDHPGLWILGAPVALLTFWGVAAFWEVPLIPALLGSVLLGRMGLLKVLGLPLITEIGRGLGSELDTGWMTAGGLAAALLWVGIGAVAVIVAALRFRQA